MFTLKLPRLAGLLLCSLILFGACLVMQSQAPTSLIAVSLYKLHMASLAGWTGYWLDRLTFPYSRPHELIQAAEDAEDHGTPAGPDANGLIVAGFSYGAEQAMFRRAIIIAACVIGICLGA
jgi:hypothetical protein